jgi:hypothetical protein
MLISNSEALALVQESVDDMREDGGFGSGAKVRRETKSSGHLTRR